MRTHGLLRAAGYLDAFRDGSVPPVRIPLDVSEVTAAVVEVDGGGAFGHVPTWEAISRAIPMSRSHGVCIALIRNIRDFGRAAYYAQYAAERGQVAVVCQNTMPILAPPGGTAATHGNNPLAFAVPGQAGPLFDAAWSPRAVGQLLLSQLEDVPLDPAWQFRAADGAVTTDPAHALGVAQQPVAGHKGFGISVLVDVLAGVLTGSPSGPAVGSGRAVTGAFALIISPEALGRSATEMAETLSHTADAVRDAGGRWPGERASAARARALESGTLETSPAVFNLLNKASGGRMATAFRA